MRICKKLVVLLLCFFSLMVVGHAQDNVNKKQRKIEKKRALRAQEDLKKYQNSIKYHHKIQSKDTRKRMKDSLKKSKKASPGYKKELFLKHWFSRKKRR